MGPRELVVETPLGRGDEGFALAGTLFVVVLLSIIAIASLQTTGDERRAGRAVRESTPAFYAADAGLNAVVAAWDLAKYDTLLTVPGDSLDLGWQSVEDGSNYRAVLRRVDAGSSPTLFSVTVTGRGPGLNRGERTLGLFLAAGSVNVGDFARSVVLTKGNMEAVSDPTSTIDGNDTNPPGWTCDAPGPAVPGLLVQDTALLSQGPGTILGNPPIAEDSTISATSFAQFGDVTYAELVAMADKSYPGNSQPAGFGPVVSGGQCVTTELNNWGDPLNPNAPCGDYFPIIHFAGDVEFTTTGSAGQGILLTDGDLNVGGGDFTFYGLIIVQGGCVFEYDSTVYGGILCANQASVNQEIGDAAPLSYSRCALEQALAGAGLGGSIRPLSERAWHQVMN